MKKLQKLTLKQLENEMTVIGSDEQREMIGGDDPNTWASWDDVPGTLNYTAVADVTYVYVDTLAYQLSPTESDTLVAYTGCDVTITSLPTSNVITIIKESLVEWYDSIYGDDPAGGPFAKGTIGHTLMEYYDYFTSGD